MNKDIKKVSYSTTNTYETLNTLSDTTKNVWLVFHGMGFLSKFFLRYFDGLIPEENYIIAPQAPSKYYLKNEFKHVGASWLTKENTVEEFKNVSAYIQKVLEAENIPQHMNLIVLGFSQGVSIATRYLAKTKLNCNSLVMYAGGLPNELKASDFAYLLDKNTKITCIVGDTDEYLIPEKMILEKRKLNELFKGKAELIIFKGGHEMKKDIISDLIK